MTEEFHVRCLSCKSHIEMVVILKECPICHIDWRSRPEDNEPNKGILETILQMLTWGKEKNYVLCDEHGWTSDKAFEAPERATRPYSHEDPYSIF